MQKHLRNLLVIAVLFFLFGFITNINDILMPYLKRACELTDFQTAFVQSAFFGAYFLMSIPASMIISRMGYKNSIVIGLLIAALGAVLFVPAAMNRDYSIFLAALAVLATGITLLQVAANPYVSLLGEPSGAASRLSLMGGLNSLGATLGPFIGGMLILSHADLKPEEVSALPPDQKLSYLNEQAELVINPYIILTVFLVALAVMMFFAKLPHVQAESRENKLRKLNIFSYPKLWLGILGIFFYVGAEVGVGSYIIRYGQYLQLEGYSEQAGSRLVSAYMLGAMVFRFIGIPLLNMVNPMRALIVNAAIAILLLLVSVFSSGYPAIIAVVLVGCCNAMMWPIIFPKAIEGLGIHTPKGSSYLIMAVVGGALIPPVMGLISDNANIQLAYLVPVICYAFIAFYGWRFKRDELLAE